MATYLLDTNILLRSSDHNSPLHQLASEAVNKLLVQGHLICITSQTIIEFWAVATRPLNVNGLGWSVEQTHSEVDQLLEQFPLLEKTPQIFNQWLNYVVANKVKGKRVHDARLIAVMLASEVTHLLTLNPDDFRSAATIKIVHPQTVLENNPV